MSDIKKQRLPHGIHTALVTPFAYGGIDADGFSRLLEIQKNSGVSGAVVLGTTGESPTVSGYERDTLAALAVNVLGGKKAVTVGCGSNDTGKAVGMCKRAAALGADFALIVTPYYNKPSQKGLLRHFLTVAEDSPLPIVIYNVPSRTGVDISAETLSVLSAHENVAGFKEASSDLGSVTAKMQAAPDLPFFCGSDALLYHFLCLGAEGAVSVCSNIEPDRTCAVTDLFDKGDRDGCKEAFFDLYPFLQALCLDVNPVPIKTVMEAAGLISARVRPPLCAMNGESRAKLLCAASDAGININ